MTDHLESYTDLERAMTRLFRRAFLPTAGEATRRAAGVNLERAAYVALVRIAALDGARLTDLAAAIGIDVSTTSRHVRRLVDAGYVQVSPDPDDARARRYRPTASGTDALCRVRDARRAHLARVLDGWDGGDVAQLAEGLERLVDSLESDEQGQP